jgi:hypothetical protein
MKRNVNKKEKEKESIEVEGENGDRSVAHCHFVGNGDSSVERGPYSRTG